MPKKKQAFFKCNKKNKIIEITIRINYFKLLGIVIALFFAVIFSFYPFFLNNLNNQKNKKIEAVKNLNINNPIIFEIPQFGISLPIRKATVLANDWQIYNNAVSWLNGSGNLAKGNIILYGHNTQSLFGNITELKKGDLIILKNNLQEKKYQVIDSFETDKKNVQVLKSKEDRLTMYTCSGWFDSNRFFVIGKPINTN